MRVSKTPAFLRTPFVWHSFIVQAAIVAILATVAPHAVADDIADRSVQNALTRVQEIESEGHVVRCLAFGPNGLWALVYGHSGFWVSDGKSTAYDDLMALHNRGEAIRWISFTATGGHLILHGQNRYLARNVPDDLKLALDSIRGHQIKCVNFTPNGGWGIIYGRNGTRTQRVPDGAATALRELNQRNAEIDSIAFVGERGWVVIHDQYGYACNGVTNEILELLAKVNRERKTITCVSPTADGLNCVLVNYDRHILPFKPGNAVTMDQLSELMNETHRQHNEFLQSLPLEKRIPLLKQNWESSREMMRSLNELARPAK